MRKRVLFVLACCGAVLAAVMALPAGAALPGVNGKIAFSTDQTNDGQGPSDIFTVNPNGTAETQLTHGEFGYAENPSWSPDGTRIVFDGGATGTQQLYVINGDGSGGDPSHPLFNDPGNFDFAPHYSPNGEEIAFSSCQIPGFICTIDVIAADGSGVPQVLTTPNWNAQNPVWSPDGTKIAFESSQDGLLDAVWVMDANGQNQQRLTAPALEAGYPDWSPDGKHILFQDKCCVFGTNIWVMNADGSGQKQLTHMPSKHQNGFARYSPDGTKIVFISDLAYKPGSCPDASCSDLYTMDTNGTHMTKIVSDQPGVFFSDWGRQP